MNHLRRGLAPISDAAWAEVDEEAARALKTFLAARRLVDFDGPLGWDTACVGTGRLDTLAPAPVDGVSGGVRRVVPMLELRATFELSLAELDAIDRGAADPDLDPVVDAARRIALAEDRLVFEGRGEVGAAGLLTSTPHEVIDIDPDYARFPALIARAAAQLRDAGVDGPYATVLGPRCYYGVVEGTEKGGYPVLNHVELITGGPLVRARAIDGAALVSMRGGDYELTVGQDLSIGYLGHTAETVTLYIEESLAFRNLAPEATVALRHP
ncbi:MAG: family 1 encapsulin nanocompartment shell protein [Actinomycetota bacterium]|nr:family 1 encapsulin nanocompartment shell protein [Actinomycetota bacterium]